MTLWRPITGVFFKIPWSRTQSVERLPSSKSRPFNLLGCMGYVSCGPLYFLCSLCFPPSRSYFGSLFFVHSHSFFFLNGRHVDPVMGETIFPVEELIAMVLSHAKKQAEEFGKENVGGAVITVSLVALWIGISATSHHRTMQFAWLCIYSFCFISFLAPHSSIRSHLMPTNLKDKPCWMPRKLPA